MLPLHLHLVLVSVVVLLLPKITVSFSPVPACFAAGKLVKDTIWIFSGFGQDGQDPSDDVFLKSLWSLDVSQPFSSSSPPWTDHSPDGVKLEFVYARDFATLETGADDNILWAYGGGNMFAALKDYKPIITYDIKAKSWSIPSIKGTPLPIWKTGGARVGNEMLYYIGGSTDYFSSSNSTPFTRIDTVETLNTVTGEYKVISATPSNLPGRHGHSVIPIDKQIYVFGGGIPYNPTNMELLPMNAIDVFDTTNNTWTTRNITGNDFPQSRRYSTAALASDNQSIIIFGGRNVKLDFLNDVWIFDVVKFSWTKANTTGTPPPELYGSNAFIVGDQMLVMFGANEKIRGLPVYSNKIYILDMSKQPWAWVETFTPSSTST